MLRMCLLKKDSIFMNKVGWVSLFVFKNARMTLSCAEEVISLWIAVIYRKKNSNKLTCMSCIDKHNAVIGGFLISDVMLSTLWYQSPLYNQSLNRYSVICTQTHTTVTTPVQLWKPEGHFGRHTNTWWGQGQVLLFGRKLGAVSQSRTG